MTIAVAPRLLPKSLLGEAMGLQIHVADVGSSRRSFGWTSGRLGEKGFEFENSDRGWSGLISAILGALQNGQTVALGLEAPLFLPLPADEADSGDLPRRYPVDLTLRKKNDDDAPRAEWAAWFAQGGASSSLSAQAFLARLIMRVDETHGELEGGIFTNPKRYNAGMGPALWVFEAFVSGAAKTCYQDQELRGSTQLPSGVDNHAWDAFLAASSFSAWRLNQEAAGMAPHGPDYVAPTMRGTRVTRSTASALADHPEKAVEEWPDRWINLVERTVRDVYRRRPSGRAEFSDFLVVKVLAKDERKHLKLPNT